VRLLKTTSKVPMEDEERHASWLEVFFDLVFVLAVSHAGRLSAEHLTPFRRVCFLLGSSSLSGGPGLALRSF